MPSSLSLPADTPTIPTFSSTTGPSTIVNTYGAVLIGTCFGLILYGLIIHMTYLYWRMYPQDSRWLKGLVITVLILETFNAVLTSHICYHFLVTSFSKPELQVRSVWSIALLPVASGALVITCQSFFARRIILMRRYYRPIAVIAMILLIGELGFFTASTIESFTTETLARFSEVVLFSVGSGMVVVADIMLTTVLIIALHHSRTGLKGTDSMLDRLVLYSINTGLLTGVFNIVSFILSVIYPDNLIYCAVAIVDARLYAITLLAALNSRRSLARLGVMTFGSTDNHAANVTSLVFAPTGQSSVPPLSLSLRGNLNPASRNTNTNTSTVERAQTPASSVVDLKHIHADQDSYSLPQCEWEGEAAGEEAFWQESKFDVAAEAA